MALRFRRYVRLAPGLRLNVTGSGLSLTAGPQGASVNFGSRGTFVNTGLPGTGLYSRDRVGAPARQAVPAAAAPPGKVHVTATVSVEDDGTVTIRDENGKPVSDYLMNLAKRQQGDAIRGVLGDCCARINGEVDALQRIHEYTPAPDDRPRWKPEPFAKERPTQPVARPVGFFDRLFGRRAAIEAQNASALAQFEEQARQWKAERAEFERNQVQEVQQFDEFLVTIPEFMQQVLEQRLASIEWPRETVVSFELAPDAKRISLDVDLPEIEGMPHRQASVPARGYKLSMKEIKGKQLAEIYRRHVYGVGFRIIGEVFATLPTVETVTLSGFTQRVEPATGRSADTYIYSVHVSRSQWQGIDVQQLGAVDPGAALASFGMRSRSDRSGSLLAVEPLDAGEPAPAA